MTTRWVLLSILIINHSAALFTSGHDVGEPRKEIDASETCTTDDLNHSVLVECKGLKCTGMSQKSAFLRPTSWREVVHTFSSRTGDRFVAELSQNLDFHESEVERSFDINTTLYVDTQNRFQEILGFGTTLDITKFLNHLDESSNEDGYMTIMKDLFADPPQGIQLSLLRLRITNDSITKHNITQSIDQADRLAAQVASLVGQQKIKVIISLEDLDVNLEMVESLRSIAGAIKLTKALECLTISINPKWVVLRAKNSGGMLEYVRELFPRSKVLGFTGLNQATSLKVETRSALHGLLIKSEYSTPYDVLDFVRAFGDDFSLITEASGKPKIAYYGDWQNAQNYAVEILQHLEHGSNGFVETSSIAEILREPDSQDCSIYSLEESHQLHFRAPMFFAIGHFSRYLPPGSRLLGHKVSTAPNMFAAHYQAFLTPQNEVIAIVLNDNEHLLPFRMALDDRIVFHSNLKPKSFNTIAIKQR